MTSTPALRINGERQIFENKRRRFAREFSIPSYCDTNEVSAKFEGGVLTIKFPKLITPAYNNNKPMPQQEKESAENEVDKNKQDLPQKEKEPITSDEKGEINKIEKSPPQKENEPKPISDDDKEKDNKTEQVVQPKEVRPNGVSETAQERPKAKITQRLKTRVLDFTVSLRSAEEPDVKQGNKSAKLIKKPKIWMNIVVTILLVMVLGLYVKNAFKSYQLGGSKFEEL